MYHQGAPTENQTDVMTFTNVDTGSSACIVEAECVLMGKYDLTHARVAESRINSVQNY